MVASISINAFAICVPRKLAPRSDTRTLINRLACPATSSKRLEEDGESQAPGFRSHSARGSSKTSELPLSSLSHNLTASLGSLCVDSTDLSFSPCIGLTESVTSPCTISVDSIYLHQFLLRLPNRSGATLRTSFALFSGQSPPASSSCPLLPFPSLSTTPSPHNQVCSPAICLTRRMSHTVPDNPTGPCPSEASDYLFGARCPPGPLPPCLSLPCQPCRCPCLAPFRHPSPCRRAWPSVDRPSQSGRATIETPSVPSHFVDIFCKLHILHRRCGPHRCCPSVRRVVACSQCLLDRVGRVRDHFRSERSVSHRSTICSLTSFEHIISADISRRSGVCVSSEFRRRCLPHFFPAVSSLSCSGSHPSRPSGTHVVAGL